MVFVTTLHRWPIKPYRYRVDTVTMLPIIQDQRIRDRPNRALNTFNALNTCNTIRCPICLMGTRVMSHRHMGDRW